MPTLTHQLTLAQSPAEVFGFLCDLDRRIQLLPPESPLVLVEGPPRLELGSRTTWQIRRFGLSQTIVLEVTDCVPPARLVEEQRQGPMRRWVQGVTCTAHGGGSLVQDVIEFEPPGGMLGLLVTASKIEEMLKEALAWRDQRLRNLLETNSS